MDRHKEINDAGGNGETGNCSMLLTTMLLTKLMPYFHWRTRTQIQIRTRNRSPNPMATYYYAEHISTDSDSDSDPFPNGYCAHFRDGYPSQEQIFVPITYISIRGSESKSELMGKSCTVQESVCESESEYCNGNKPLE